jgi:oligopeptide transport system substrate-binding protein
MWITELNIEVQMAIQEWKAYLQGLRIHSPHVYRLGWCQDYPDASNFDRDVFRSDSDNNHTNFANEEYDRLVDEAMVETDTAKRLELYRQTEQILTYEDAAIIPIYWYTTVSVTKPYVNRTYSLTGHQRYEKWSFGG